MQYENYYLLCLYSSLPPGLRNFEFRLFGENQLKRIFYYSPWQ